jgi:hypothetical protein
MSGMLKKVGAAGAVGAIALTGIFMAAPQAGAKAPPAATYDCVISGLLFGKVKIKSAGAYTRNGTKGKFVAGSTRVTFPDRIKGWRLTFRTGSFRGMKGRWYRTSTPGVSEIALKNPRDDFESIYCTQRR